MCVHLQVVLERKEAFEKGENLVGSLLRHGMVLDVEEPAYFTRISDLCSYSFPLRKGAAQVAHVDCRDGREAGRRLCDLAVGGLGA